MKKSSKQRKSAKRSSGKATKPAASATTPGTFQQLEFADMAKKKRTRKTAGTKAKTIVRYSSPPKKSKRGSPRPGSAGGPSGVFDLVKYAAVGTAGLTASSMLANVVGRMVPSLDTGLPRIGVKLAIGVGSFVVGRKAVGNKMAGAFAAGVLIDGMADVVANFILRNRASASRTLQGDDDLQGDEDLQGDDTFTGLAGEPDIQLAGDMADNSSGFVLPATIAA